MITEPPVPEPDTATNRTRRIIVINGGTSDPSSSRMLADRIAQKSIDQLALHGIPSTTRVLELGPLAGEISHAIVSGIPAGELVDAVEVLASADGIIVSTPVYKAGISGLVKSFIDILDNDLLIATPVVLAATAGSARHALVADDHLRPLFAYMRALIAPTAVFAAPEDWADPALGRRIDRAAAELAALVSSGVADVITGRMWNGYQHTFGSSARPADAVDTSVDFDTDLMRLAAGGSAMRDSA
ncbi:NAD(P)H-dependent oxidoreductase [Clavibacter sp. VKM Ac-2873]|uniref:CE1759 family FMN reductase n=1 Tax=Clavibacter sp. VKM Ac-2873 TaxID=2783813 RepID=UPI00188BEBD8|nr:CE1759 family FMN reductase [Clavibacter sp. VKM Ac-2873]MBF4617483.1 NAD(P)H-dependent oxidoreductase [Clavibacter sp. VKM Ac-2873]